MLLRPKAGSYHFDHKVARDPIRFLTSSIAGNGLLQQAELDKTLALASPLETRDALDANVWALDKPFVLALFAWAHLHLEKHVPIDACAHPSTCARHASTTSWACEEQAPAAACEGTALLAQMRP